MTDSDSRARRLKRLQEACRVIPDCIALSASDNPDKIAYHQYDHLNSRWESMTYAELMQGITKWRKVLTSLELKRGDRIALLLGNSIDAVLADQAVLANALVPVPLDSNISANVCAFQIQDSEAALFVTDTSAHWKSIALSNIALPNLEHVIVIDDDACDTSSDIQVHRFNKLVSQSASIMQFPKGPDPDDLATIAYTSGTTGQPKGVMLTHRNLVTELVQLIQALTPWPQETFEFLSFLPLSHMFERTVGYYMPLAMGCTIWFNRSIALLGEDLQIARPHLLVSVTPIFERIYAKMQDELRKHSFLERFLVESCVSLGWRRHCRLNGISAPAFLFGWVEGIFYLMLRRLVAQKMLGIFGGRFLVALIGGSTLSAPVARFFIGLGLSIVHGYGMTECSPVISVNRYGANNPQTVGSSLPGVRVRVEKETRELQVAGDIIMKGYWERPDDTAAAFNGHWFRTGDFATIDDHRLIRIQGRMKDLIVTSAGETVMSVDLEAALEKDPLFTQTCVFGSGRPYIVLVAVLNRREWESIAECFGINPASPVDNLAPTVRAAILNRARSALSHSDFHAMPKDVIVTFEPWTIEKGFLTPTLKLKRRNLYEHFKPEIETMYCSSASGID